MKIYSLVFLLTLSMALAARAGEPNRDNQPQLNPNAQAQPKAPTQPRRPRPVRDKVRVLSDKDFQRAIRRGISAVYFWAEWCGPCRHQGPIMDDMAKKYANRVKVFKVDIDSELEARAKYDIRQVPSTIIFKDGKAAVKMVGVVDMDEMSEEVELLLPQRKQQPAAAASKPPPAG